MKMIKNKLKIILAIVISIVITSVITTYAAYDYFAKDVSYIKTDGTEINVQDALNELYNNYKIKSSKPYVEGIYSISAQNINYTYTLEDTGIYIVGLQSQGINPTITTTGKLIKEYEAGRSKLNIIKGNIGDTISLTASNTYYNAGGFIVKINNFEISECIANNHTEDASISSTYTATEDEEIVLAIAFTSGKTRTESINYDKAFLGSYYHENDCYIDIAILKKGTTVTATSYGYNWSNSTTYIFK